jgi:hypothetical protein
MSSAPSLLLADAEPATRGFLELHLPRDGFELVGAHARFDLVLAGDVAGVDRWVERAPVIVLGREQADAVDRIRAFRQGCDDYVVQPFEYQELVGALSGSRPFLFSGSTRMAKPKTRQPQSLWPCFLRLGGCLRSGKRA